MAQYLIGVDFQPGDDPAPMTDWTPEEVQAHLDYYEKLVGELEANGELVSKTSNKFWEIALAGSAFETRNGRRGTPGQPHRPGQRLRPRTDDARPRAARGPRTQHPGPRR